MLVKKLEVLPGRTSAGFGTPVLSAQPSHSHLAVAVQPPSRSRPQACMHLSTTS
jgi:hypothetical protein